MDIPKEIPFYHTKFPIANKLYRLVWELVRLFLFRPFIGVFFNGWRITILRIMGAKIGAHSIIYASSRIWMPKNLEVGEHSCIGPNTNIYNPSKISLGNKVVVSQNSYLCGGSHNIHSFNLDFISAPIVIKDYSWVCANCFVMMGVTIEEGCVIGATSSLFKSTEPWSVYGGVPAKYIKKREIDNE